MSNIDEVKRLLGEAMVPIQEVIEWTDYDTDEKNLEEAIARITEALSVLENMEEGEAFSMERNMDLHGCQAENRRLRLALAIAQERLAELGPFTLPDIQAGMDRSMWERYGYEAVDDDPDEQARRRAAAKKPPAEEPGCPLSDAMGGTGEPRIESVEYYEADGIAIIRGRPAAEEAPLPPRACPYCFKLDWARRADGTVYCIACGKDAPTAEEPEKEDEQMIPTILPLTDKKDIPDCEHVNNHKGTGLLICCHPKAKDSSCDYACRNNICPREPPAEEPDNPPFTKAGKMIEKMNAEESIAEGGHCPYCKVVMDSDYHFRRPDGDETTWYECPKCKRQFDFLSGEMIYEPPAEEPEPWDFDCRGCPYNNPKGPPCSPMNNSRGKPVPHDSLCYAYDAGREEPEKEEK